MINYTYANVEQKANPIRNNNKLNNYKVLIKNDSTRTKFQEQLKKLNLVS